MILVLIFTVTSFGGGYLAYRLYKQGESETLYTIIGTIAGITFIFWIIFTCLYFSAVYAVGSINKQFGTNYTAGEYMSNESGIKLIHYGQEYLEYLNKDE